MSFRRWLPIVLFGCLLLGLPFIYQSQAESFAIISGEKPLPAQKEALRLTSDGFHFTLNTAEIWGAESGWLETPDLEDRIQEAGAPALPFYATYIALPPGAEAEVTVAALDVVEQRLSVPLLPAPESRLEEGAEEWLMAGAAVTPDLLFDSHFEPDPAIYGRDALYPESLFELSPPMMARDVRLARLVLYPARYNPVSQTLVTARQLEVEVRFTSLPAAPLEPIPTHQDAHLQALAGLVLNYEQAAAWRHRPETLEAPATLLPVGGDAYKIEVNQDGIYRVTYEDLQAAGMDVAAIDPQTIQMVYRGQPVAYLFDGDPANGFQPGEAVLFYGWAFNGSRLESQFFDNNVFWLWAGGTAATIQSRSSEEGFPLAESFWDSVTFDEQNYWFSTWTHQWDSFPNEGNAWFWDRYRKTTVNPITKTYPITLPYPAPAGADAHITAEFNSKWSPFTGGVRQPHTIHLYLNEWPEYGSLAWYDKQNVNVTATAPITSVLDGSNLVDIVVATNGTMGNQQEVYLTRITVDYLRQFIAVDDQLIFGDEEGGQRSFQIEAFTTADPLYIWDISDPYLPEAIGNAAVSGSGPYSLAFGSQHDAGARFIAAAVAHTPLSISRYDVPDIQPAGAGADWIAIAHSSLLAEAQQLANHRADPAFGGLAAHVVDIEDVVNQYGYGLPVPQAVRAYLAHGLANWQPAPQYLVMIGDASDNPRFHHCVACPPGWDHEEPHLALTDMVYKDRWQGRIPSDLPFTLLVGDDLLADLAVGRIAAQTPAEAAGAIEKIIQYEQNHLDPAHYDWLNDILFVSDRPDTGAGNFCHLNEQSGQRIAGAFDQQRLCVPASPTVTDVVQVRTEMFAHINAGASLLNYRGHGAVARWGSAVGGELLLTTGSDYAALWDNAGRPPVVLSMDCLDGYFILPGNPGLGETYLTRSQTGSAAHWSSTGLGTTFEHSVLHNYFYEGLFDVGLTAIGDAVNYAKLRYYQAGAHSSLLYSFLLQGDPAMQLMRPDLHLSKTAAPETVAPGDTVDFVLEVTNQGLYPALTSVSDTLPAPLSFITATASVPAEISVDGQQLLFTLDYGGGFPNRGLPYQATAVITITAVVDPQFGGGLLTNEAVASSPGLPINPQAAYAAASIVVLEPPDWSSWLYLPVVVRP